MEEQSPFGAVSFSDNPDPRCPLVLLLDVSGSMSGQPIEELNSGLQTLKDELMGDALAAKRVEIGIVTFGPVETKQDFVTVDTFYPPMLESSGDTPMGAAIKRGIEMVNQRKATYKQAGVAYYRPWIFLITDGAPTDAWSQAAALVREGEASKNFAFFAVGVSGANMEVLKQIATREPMKLSGLKFRELFMWLSASMKAVSQSTVGATVPIAPPSGWNEV